MTTVVSPSVIRRSRPAAIMRLFEPRAVTPIPVSEENPLRFVQSRRRSAAIKTMSRYGSRLGFFDDLFAADYEDAGMFSETADDFGDYAYYDEGVIDVGPDYGGDTVLDLGPLMGDEFGTLALPDAPIEVLPAESEYDLTPRIFEDEEELADRRTPGYTPPSAPSSSPSLISAAGALLSSIFGASTAAASRRIQTGAQQPGTVYLPGTRPGSVLLPGQPSTATPRYAVPTSSAIPRAVQQAGDFVKKNAVPLAIGAGVLAVILLSGGKRKKS